MLNVSDNTIAKPKASMLGFSESEQLMKELDEIDLKNSNYKLDKSLHASQREDQIYSLKAELSPNRPRTISEIKRDFQLGDIIDFVHQGMNVSSTCSFLQSQVYTLENK